MNDKRYRYILYAITLVIIATIGIQIYWNYKNYLTNKQQLVNDVQTSLDKAVDDYYADLAKKTTLAFSFQSFTDENLFDEDSKFSEILKNIDEENKQFKNLDSIDANDIEGITLFRGLEADSMMNSPNVSIKSNVLDSFSAQIKGLRITKSDVDFSEVKTLTQKVFVSINNDTLDIKKINSLLKIDLLRKDINANYNLTYKDKRSFKKSDFKIVSASYDSTQTDSLKHNHSKWNLRTVSRSTFLPAGSELQISFTNETRVVLQRMLGGISISTLLVLAVISCLFYLLKIIKHQKQLAEVKNDLISNITHEFKTPIATISVALESITSFNSIENKEKTKKYIDMSSNQLSKLNVMVEKLLETATLDSDSLELNKEEVDMVSLLMALCNKYQIQNTEKTIQTHFKVEDLITKIDVFHFENAINNILDNAIKYGGDLITIDLIPKNESFEIIISDNGSGINKVSKDRIFEKFYRVPKGNTHDVKGFGIGLYYTKTIIDKHGGSIILDINNTLTTFKINLPNV